MSRYYFSEKGLWAWGEVEGKDGYRRQVSLWLEIMDPLLHITEDEVAVRRARKKWEAMFDTYEYYSAWEDGD